MFNFQVIAFGTAQSVGVYNIEFLRAFDAGAAAVSLVGSINLGVFLGAGKDRASPVVKKFVFGVSYKVQLKRSCTTVEDC